MITFAEEKRLFIANTFFEKNKNRYWTWESPNGEHKNQIDFILCSEKTTIEDCEVITKVDVGSDHRMVKAKIKINKKLIRLKHIKQQKPMKLRIYVLEAKRDEFEINLWNRFTALEGELTLDAFNTIIEEERSTIQMEKTPVRKKTTPEDKRIEEIDKKRKELHKKENKTKEEKIKYSELDKTVKKMKRERNRRKRKELVTTILEKEKGPREISKKGCRKKITSMLKENGETTKEREEMLSICSDFYKKLYAKNRRKATGSGRKKPREGESTKAYRQGNQKYAQKLE